MRCCLIVALLGLGSLPTSVQGQPPAARRAGKLETLPATKPTGRLTSQTPATSIRGSIRVEFHGQRVRIASMKDVSNVVLQYSDGTRQKFEDLDDRTVELKGTGTHAGKEIVCAWVKSGPNFSGDGPGYGLKFERPQASRRSD